MTGAVQPAPPWATRLSGTPETPARQVGRDRKTGRWRLGLEKQGESQRQRRQDPSPDSTSQDPCSPRVPLGAAVLPPLGSLPPWAGCSLVHPPRTPLLCN